MPAAARIALVQGSSRGLGLALARFLLAKTSLHVVATTSREPEKAREAILGDNPSSDLVRLKDLDKDQWPNVKMAEMKDRLECLYVNVKRPETLAEAASKVEGLGMGKLRLLLNVSGILRVEKSLKDLDLDSLIESFQVNSIGPLLTIKHFAPLLPTSRDLQDGDKDHSNGWCPAGKSVIANLSARTGSIADNRAGGWYSYRASKAALNQMTKTLSHELSLKKTPAYVVALHPGTVATGLSADFRSNLKPGQLFSPERSADHLMHVISSLDKTGQFLDWKGETIPW